MRFETYQLNPAGGVFGLPDWHPIPNDPNNADWQEYQAWLAEGNHPIDPAAPPVRPEPPPLTPLRVGDPEYPADAVNLRFLEEQLDALREELGASTRGLARRK